LAVRLGAARGRGKVIDYYEVLGVSPNSDGVVIRAAYKAMMSKYHPDINKDKLSEERAKQINQAYSVLGDPEKRRDYDEKRSSRAREAPNGDRAREAPPASPARDTSTSRGGINESGKERGSLSAINQFFAFGIFGAVVVALFMISLNTRENQTSAPSETGVVEGGRVSVMQYSSRFDEFTDTMYSSATGSFNTNIDGNGEISVSFECVSKRAVMARHDAITATFSLPGPTSLFNSPALKFRIDRGDAFNGGLASAKDGSYEYKTNLHELAKHGDLTKSTELLVQVVLPYSPSDPGSYAKIPLDDENVKRVFADCNSDFGPPVSSHRSAIAASTGRSASRPAPKPSSFGGDVPLIGASSSAARVITQPEWLRRPNAEDLERYFPERAQRMNVEGRASISCTVDVRGTLQNCSVSLEDPNDQGFGDAALRMSKLFKMRPMTKDGVPVDGGKITIPIAFRLPKTQPSA
jgi:TonB family protein